MIRTLCSPLSCPRLSRASRLEHFQEKWTPVFRPKMRQCKNARAVSVSGLCETALAEKFDRDLRWGFVECFLNLFGGLRQSIGIDIDPDAAARAGHVLVCLQASDSLIEVLPAIRTLK